jgi:hypothetical protein
MSEFFVRNPGLLIPCLAIAGGVLIAVVAILSSAWRKHRQAEIESALKQDMLNRGMSADEIVRVVRACAGEEPAPPEAKDPVSDNEYYLVEKLVEEGKSAEEIERIIRAVKSGDGRPAVRPTDIVRAPGD